MHTLIENQFRYEVYTTILSGDATNYYDVSSFRFHTYDGLRDIISTIREELHDLGWTTIMSYGDTALFVYSGPKPGNCW